MRGFGNKFRAIHTYRLYAVNGQPEPLVNMSTSRMLGMDNTASNPDIFPANMANMFSM